MKELFELYGRLRPLLLAIVLCALTGCASTGRHIRAYSGEPANTNQVALLKVRHDSFNAFVETIDGVSLRKGKQFVANTTREIEFLPGRHDLEVAYTDSSGGHSISNAPISFIAEAGKVYELHVAPMEKAFGTKILEQLIGGKFSWTAWIIDAESKIIVAGQHRETPLHWYEK